jgi:phthiocerol/phenolphthiocerol synthesis type-I polyketide synthase C
MADDLAVVDSTTATGNTASIAANRISYAFDLRGPSMAIDTACSSSLVAFHQACRSILSGESTHALAGGISLHLHPYGFLVFAKASMLSRRGRCNVFDAAGDGYVRSEGGGVFFLKDHAQALADGDPILAVIAGSVVNTDGRKSGLTVPSAEVQAALLEEAYARAGIDPAAIDYLEAHGTGTAVGDPIETFAIGQALGKRRPGSEPLPIGSVKSNMGHLETASGVAGLVKALHCIQHRVVPATIGVNIVNPNIKLADWNLDLVTSNRWNCGKPGSSSSASIRSVSAAPTRTSSSKALASPRRACANQHPRQRCRSSSRRVTAPPCRRPHASSPTF